MNELERNIAARIGQFDILALLRLLADAGYGPQEIRFRGTETICSQERLIRGIRFFTKPFREVEITLNTGLMGAHSPLPSYFRKRIESDIALGHDFMAFIGFFDHVLILDYLCGVYPEINRFFGASPEMDTKTWLSLLDLRSPSALHVLFARAFPEADVELEKRILGREVEAEPVVLGTSCLGPSCILGNETEVAVCGRRIVLHFEEEVTETRIPWAEEAKRRLERLIFPLIGPLGLEMEIDLVMQERGRWVRLSPGCRLGYDTLKGVDTGPRRMPLFRGQVPKHPVAA